MSEYSVGEAAELIGVGADSIRRWADQGRLSTGRTDGNHRIIDGADLARLAVELAEDPESDEHMSARNRFEGLVTKVTTDLVMAQVELLCGRNRIVALISAEAVRDLGLEPGVRAVATIKATNVIIDTTR